AVLRAVPVVAAPAHQPVGLPFRGGPVHPGADHAGTFADLAARAQPRRPRPAAGLGHDRAWPRPGRALPARGPPANGWPGVAMALAALGLLLASAPAAQRLVEIIPNVSSRLSAGTASPAAGYGRSRRALACVALAAAATAPLLVAGYWVKEGVRGPVGNIAAPLVPAYVSASSTSGEQYRTLILRPDGTGLNYLVARQGDPTLGEAELRTAATAGAALSRQVAALVAPNEADAGDPGLVLGSFGIRWVLLPSPVNPVIAQRLDASLGLVALNKGSSYDLWQVTGPVSRGRVVAGDGNTTALSSRAVPGRGGQERRARPGRRRHPVPRRAVRRLDREAERASAQAGRDAGERLGAGIRAAARRRSAVDHQEQHGPRA